MMTVDSPKPATKPRFGFLTPRIWLALSILLSVSIISMLAWLHLQQRESLRRTLTEQDLMHNARIELSKGVLFSRLAGEADLPLSREQGTQLINEAVESLSGFTGQPFAKSFEEDDTQALAAFHQRIIQFKQQFADLNKVDNLQQENAFRLAYFELEQQADKLDSLTRNSHQIFYKQMDEEFGWVFFFSLALLMGNFGLVNASLRAKALVDSELKDTQAALQQAVKTASVGLWHWNFKTNEFVFSQEWKRQLGYQPSEIKNTYSEWKNRVHPDDLASTKSTLQQYLAHGEGTVESEFRMLHRDGSYRWILGSASAQKDSEGQLVSLLGSNVDITARKVAESALRANELLFRNVFNQLFQLMVILTPEGRIYELNELSLKERKVSREDCLGKFYWEAAGWENIPNAKDLWQPLFESAAQSHEPLLVEQTYPAPDGTTRSADCALQAIRNAAGEVQFIIVQASETTQRKRAEEALRLSEDRLRQLHAITSKPELKHRERIQQLLALGVEQFGLENGVLSEITDQHCNLAQVFSLDQSLSAGLRCERNQVLCDVALHHNDLLEIQSVGQSQWKDHSGCTMFGMESYLGLPVQVDSQIYGTLCFFSRQPRKQPLTNGDHEFIRLMAQWISAELTRHRFEEGLLRSEERLRLALDAGKMGAWCLYPDRGVFDYDENSTRLYGFQPGQFNGTSEEALATLHPDDAAEVVKLVQQAIANRTVYHSEYRVIHPDQSVHWIASYGRSFYNHDDTLIGFKGVAVEITDRKVAEDQLRRSESHFRTLFEAGSVANVETDVDTGKFLLVNKKMCELTGYSAEELLALRFSDITHPDDREVDFERWSLFVTGRLSSYITDKRYVCKDGSVIWVNITASLMYDEQGDPTHTVGVIQNITERKKAEALLRESEERFRTLFERSAVGNAIIDIHTRRIVDCNLTAAEMLGYSREEFLQLSVPDINAQLTSEGWWKVEEEVERTGKAQFETVHRAKNGELRDVLVITSNIQMDGELYGSTSFLDITEHKRNEACLRESEARFRKLFEQSAVGNLIIDIENLQIWDCNSTACQMLGYTREELLQLTITDVNPHVEVQKIERIAQEAKVVGYAQFETTRRTKSGEMLDVLVVASSIQINSKKYWTSSFLDITEQKRSEAALHSERQRLSKIAAVSPSVIFSFRVWSRTKMEFVYASPAIFEIFGKHPDDLKDASIILDLIHPDDLQRLIDSMVVSTKNKTDWHGTWRVNHPLKGEIWVEGYASPVDEGDSIIWYGMLNNVTERVKTEAALQKREKLFSNVFNQQFQYMAILSPEGHVREINDLPIRLRGETREDYLDKLLWETPLALNMPQWKTLWPARLAEAVKSSEAVLSDDNYILPDGTWGYVDTATVAARNERNEVEYFIVHASDKTKRKRQEIKLAERERLLSAINNTVPSLIILWDIASGRATYVNQSLAQILGYTAAEMLAKTGDEIQAIFHPADVPTLRELHRQLYRGPEGVVKENEIRAQHKNGEWRTILGRDVIFERDGQGRPLTMLSVADDVTERRKAEAALRESEQRFRQLTESLPQMVWTCQPDGQCDYLSPQWVTYTGQSDKSQLGFGWLEHVHPADREPTFARWMDAASAGTNLEMEFRIRRHDGSYRWFQTRALAFRDSAGQIIKWFGTNTDVQDLREMSETLREQKEHLQTLSDVSRRFAEAGPDYDDVVQDVVKVIGETTEDYCAVCLFAEDGETLQTVGAFHPDPQLDEFVKQVLGKEPYALVDAPFDRHVYETGLPAFLPEIDQALLLQTVDERFRPIVERISFQSLIVTPMRNEGRILGLVCVGRTQPHLPAFDAQDLTLLQEISDRAALALRNAQLYQQVQAELAMRQNTEVKLLREQERLGAIAAATPGVLYSFRQAPDGRFSVPYASRGIERIYGVTPEILEQDSSIMGPLIHPDDRRPFLESIGVSARDLTPWRFEWRVNSPQAGELWLEGQSMPMREPDGGIIWYGVITDITERKRHQEELLNREHLITAINNAAPSMILLCDVRQGRIIYANQQVASLVGYSEEEILAKMHKGVFALMHPDDLPSVHHHLETLRHTQDGVVMSYEFRFQHKDGRWMNVRARDTVFERDASGHATKILSVVDDITESRQQELRLRARQRQQSALAELSQMALSRLEVQTVMQEATSLVCLTLEIDSCQLRQRVIGQPDLFFVAGAGQAVNGGKGKEVMVNIQKNGEPFGALTVYSHTQREFSADDLNFLQAVANVLSMTIERHESEYQLLHSREELRELATHLQSVREEERTAIAREIHDELGQQLTAVRLNVRWVEKNSDAETSKVRARITDTLGLVDDTIQVVRQIATSLHPAILDSFGLPAALEWQIQEFEKHSGIHCHIEALPQVIDLSRTTAIAVFRICQEAFTNIARHAAATAVTIKLWVDGENLWLRIHDNGRGIAPDDSAKSRSLGLVGMRERALSLGGEFRITGRPGWGTTVKVRVLLTPKQPLALQT